MARKKKQVFERLEKMIPTREMAALQDLVIYQETDGSYQLFNKYAIRKTPVAYEVTILTSDKKLSFNSLKNATAWCIFDKPLHHGITPIELLIRSCFLYGSFLFDILADCLIGFCGQRNGCDVFCIVLEHFDAADQHVVNQPF